MDGLPFFGPLLVFNAVMMLAIPVATIFVIYKFYSRLRSVDNTLKEIKEMLQKH